MNTCQNIILSLGIWRAVLLLPDGELPFNFELQKSNSGYYLEIMNADERIRVDEIECIQDSMIIRLPVYDSEIRVQVKEKKMSGTWYNYSRKTNQQILFKADYGIPDRFMFTDRQHLSLNSLSGKWETWFSPGSADSSLAIGIFNQDQNKISGTFLTSTGDYRFLEGNLNGDSLFLSCFDGAHAYLFKAKISEDSIRGFFYSGSHWKEYWHASRNPKIELPNPDSLTRLKTGVEQFDFEFPDESGKLLRLSDARWKGKVIVLQIMGTWCPNCLDESAFLADFYRRNHGAGFQVIALAFEKTSDTLRAFQNIRRLRERLNIEYPILLAGNREESSKKLPMLNRIMGYPTTIFLDKNKKVRRIYTGFSGPATGIFFEKYKDDFDLMIKKLLSE